MSGKKKGTRLGRIAGSRRLRPVLLAVVALLVTAIGIVCYATDPFRSLEGGTVDARFSIRGAERAPSNIVVVKVDDITLSDLNLQWPFPRKVHAQLINLISKGHPAAIAYDILFAEQSQKGQNDDLALLNAINDAHKKTVFSFTETDAKGHVRFLGSDKGTKLLTEVGSHPGSTLFPFQSGGVIRQMRYAINGLTTFAVVTAEIATHKTIAPRQFSGGHDWIDYVGPAGTIPSVSFSHVLDHKIPPSFFTNKIVVVGATQSSLQDFHPTSTDGQMPGPELQANAIDTVLRGNPLSSAPGWVNVLLIVALALAVPLASMRFRPVPVTAFAFGLAAVFAVGVQLSFNAGRVVAFVYPFGALLLSAAGSLSVTLVTEAFERVRVRDLFARFVPEDVVDEVLASAEGLRLGGVQREGTVMFCDLRGFTSTAESLTPTRVIEILNRYLSEMSDAILDHGGTLVAYMGDGIMAVFGAPLPQSDHADRALSAALEMRDVRLPRFNEWLRAEKISDGFRMGIGLNSGHVMSGHVGSERRVEYTAVGDTTNTASRIEGLTKGTPNQLLFSGATKEALQHPPDNALFVGDTEIRGRVARMELWTVPEPGQAAEIEGQSETEGQASPLQATAPEV